jgi:hypothetical protein
VHPFDRPRRPAARRGWLAAACLGATVAFGCSGTPVSPSAALSGQFGLVAGNYTLTIYVPKGNAGDHVVCVDNNNAPDTASIPVALSLLDGIYRVTPVGDASLRFQLMLQMTGPTTIYGPVLGQARDPDTGVMVTISPPVDPNFPTHGDATLSGLLAARNFAAGGIYGSVQFSLSGSARWCTVNNWILRPR